MEKFTLREMRMKRGVSIVALSNHLGISRQTYRKYERNPGSMTVDQALAVCDFLRCSLGDIFFNVEG